MKLSGLLTALVLLLALGLVVGDRMYLNKLQDEFKEIEKQRIITSNKLTTAKIVQGNLNHVYELVTENMTFEESKNLESRETRFFAFLTQCINDLKLELMAVRPISPETKGPITTYGYEVEVVGDFFKLGELCSKFENSRRIIAIDKFEVSLDNGKDKLIIKQKNKQIRVSMRLTTFLVQKQPNEALTTAERKE